LVDGPFDVGIRLTQGPRLERLSLRRSCGWVIKPAVVDELILERAVAGGLNPIGS